MESNIFETFNYSVDKVRLYTEVKSNVFQETMDKFNNYPNVKYREMRTINSYFHNFYIEGYLEKEGLTLMDFDKYGEMYQKEKVDNYTFWVGAKHNAKNLTPGLVDVVIEYNPNKTKDSELLKYVLDSLFSYNQFTVVKQIDFAIDIMQNIKTIKLLRDFKSSYKYFDNTGDDITHYMRKRNSNGHLKIYNKKNESNLDYECTRYEITLKIDMDLRFIESYIPDIGLFPDIILMGTDKQMNFIELNGTEKVLLDACIDNPNYIKELPRKNRKKIEGYMETLVQKIEFENCKNKIKFVIDEYFKSINKIKKIN